MNEYLDDPLALAVLFHITYEKLAPQSGYETRGDTRVFDPDSPNGQLMIATCAEIQKAIRLEDWRQVVKDATNDDNDGL